MFTVYHLVTQVLDSMSSVLLCMLSNINETGPEEAILHSLDQVMLCFPDNSGTVLILIFTQKPNANP